MCFPRPSGDSEACPVMILINSHHFFPPISHFQSINLSKCLTNMACWGRSSSYLGFLSIQMAFPEFGIPIPALFTPHREKHNLQAYLKLIGLCTIPLSALEYPFTSISPPTPYFYYWPQILCKVKQHIYCSVQELWFRLPLFDWGYLAFYNFEMASIFILFVHFILSLFKSSWKVK